MNFCFPGDYFFELGQKSVLPGYPKLIKDVWGIDGPIDAAFTRVNCQGKTYMFKVGEEEKHFALVSSVKCMSDHSCDGEETISTGKQVLEVR